MPKKIMIVDDEKLVTETLAGMLQLRGYQILQAFEGETALKILKDVTPDLVLLDMKLPGIDGLEVLETIRRDYPDTFVVVMTGYDVQYKKKVDQIGSDAFFVKPILVSDLQEKIEELFTKGRPSPLLAKETVTVVKENDNTPKEEIPEEEKIIPKAKILLIGDRGDLAGLMQAYFSRKEHCNADYDIERATLTESSLMQYFQPDIILFDVALVGLYGEFAATLMDMPHPPKEIIIFGDPAFKWEDADALIKRGVLYIPTPLDPKYQLPHKDIFDLLAQSLKRACIKHGLVSPREKKEDV